MRRCSAPELRRTRPNIFGISQSTPSPCKKPSRLLVCAEILGSQRGHPFGGVSGQRPDLPPLGFIAGDAAFGR
ncbi:protein of unknown function [Methylorubrum extorquens]|uniref:Uncharacterized protein n=1 Tax=Methylorubrum extorquens TaxID=408 RepID=A0A2N9AKE9_METEX|nr:protein of unknown function [Methylorubrum extorquens]